MHCPSCLHPLHPLTSETTIGTHITLDHCGNCGGTWFDSYELSSLPHHEVVRLAKMTISRHSSSSDHLSANEWVCPRDNHILSPFDSDTLPASVKFYECPHCHGMWGSMGALSSFAETMEKKVKTTAVHEKLFPDTTISLASFLSLLFLFFTTFATLYIFKTVQENRTQAETLVTSRTTIPIDQTVMVLSFRTSLPLTSEISYGPTRLEMKKETITKEPSTFHRITIRNLSANTAYLYTLTLRDASGNSYTTPFYVFSTKQ